MRSNRTLTAGATQQWGIGTLEINTSGGANIAIGYQALSLNTSGNNNIAIGVNAGNGVSTASSVISIGNAGSNISSSCFIGNIRGITTAHNDAVPVFIDSHGQLGTMSSSARFKKDIKPMDKSSEEILALKPVTFHYNSDKTNRPEFGLIAEEVAKVDPDLVVRNESGGIYTVRYEAVNAMLLNEFLKEHRTVQQQEATIARLEKQVEALTAGLQKVSAQIELNRPATPVAANNQ